MTDLNRRAVRSSFFGAFSMAAFLFLPAGTLHYWQAWTFYALYSGASTAITVYLAIKDPKMLESRINVGPTAEKEKTQKIASRLAVLSFVATLVVAAFDHRFGWSRVSPPLSFSGDLVVALGFVLLFIVLIENPYSSSTVQITQEQKVVSTGPYRFVRHPMYTVAVLTAIAMPLALGSWWAFLVVMLAIPVFVWRLLDEEQFLKKNLAGYTGYTQKVRYRLVPFVW